MTDLDFWNKYKIATGSLQSISKKEYDLDELVRKQVDNEIKVLTGKKESGKHYFNESTIKMLLESLTKSQLNLILMKIGEDNFANKHAVNGGSSKEEVDGVKKWWYVDQVYTFLTGAPYYN
tara:strand:+ start:88 stop:450 length:363 start_codon:yes stop_codon:yes gene_type:complete